MKFAAIVVSLLVSSTALAEELVIPTTFRGPGALESQWVTEIAISNISRDLFGAPVTTTVTLHRENQAPKSISLTLSPMEVHAVRDALHDWFEVQEGSGLVRISWPDSGARIAARARIYNVTATGEFGQGVPSIKPDSLSSEQFLVGLSGLNGNRSNVGVSNPHDRAVMVWIGMYDTSGLERGAFATSIPALSFRQYNDIFSHFQAGPLDAAMVRVSGVDGTIHAYASIIRNDTGDPTFVVPAN